MYSLSATDPLRPGDVLHHPAFGFAVVESVGPSGVALRWDRPGPNHPAAVTPTSLADVFKRCDPRGLLARTVQNLDAARALLSREPLVALALLLLDLGGTASKDDTRDWMTERRLVGDARFDEWYAAVTELAGADARFDVKRGVVGLAAGTTHEDVAPSSPLELPEPGTLPASAAGGFLGRLARALAEAHAANRVLDGGRSAIRLSGAGFVLRTRPARADVEARDDVRTVARVVLEQVLGTLPPPEDLADEALPPLVGAVAPDLAPELYSVFQAAACADPESEPADGLALLEHVSIALAAHETRLAMPYAPDAGVTVGFDTHIGTLKSLNGQTNQDSFFIVGDPEACLVGVADGISLSTAGSGDLASFLVARLMRGWWDDKGPSLRGANPQRVHAELEDALRRANRVVCEQAERLAKGDLERHIPMGSTVVAAVILGNRVHLVCLGDSRAYVIGRFGAAVHSADLNLESLRLREVLAGREVEWDEPRHALTSYAGHFTLDGRVEMPPMFARTFTLLPGEWLILATDGLSDYAAADEAGVLTLLSRAVHGLAGDSPTARAMALARHLVAAANTGGGGDNITVLALTLSTDEAAAEEARPVPS